MPNDSLNDLWRDLQSTAEGAPTEGFKVELPRQPLQRRRTLREKALAGVLNGYVPALLALAAGALGATMHRTEVMASTTLFASGLFFALLTVLFPLTPLVRGLWAASEARPGRYLALTLLAMGLAYTASSLTLAGFSNVYLNALSFPQWVSLLQRLYEAFLTPSTVATAAFVAVTLFAGMQRARGGAPWLETQRASRWSQAIGLLILLTPWLALAGCALTSGRLAPLARDAFEQLRRPEERKRKASAEWEELSNKLAEANGVDYTSSEAVARWTRATLLETEAAATRLLVTSPNLNHRWQTHQEICSALLRRASELRDPLELSWRILERAALDRGNDGLRPYELAQPFHKAIYPLYCQTPLSASQITEQLARIQSLEAALPSAREELNACFLSICQDALQVQLSPGPLKAFGTELPFSPELTLAEYRTRLLIYPWNEVLDQLDYSSSENLQRSLNLQLTSRTSFGVGRRSEDLLVNAALESGQRHTGLLCRTRLQGARVLLLLRQYKDEHGAYPDSLEKLDLPLPGPDYVYSSNGQQATVTFRFCRTAVDGQEEATWKLL